MCHATVLSRDGTVVSEHRFPTNLKYLEAFARSLPRESVFAIEAGWYALVAMCFSGRVLRRGYLSAKVWIDRAASAAMTALGVRLILTAYGRSDLLR